MSGPFQGVINVDGHIPFEGATTAEVLGERGWNTYMLGKWHLCPCDGMNLASTKRNRPVGRGFERYRGRFDMGYERYRELIFERRRLGIFPESAELSPLNPYAEESSADGKPWNPVDVVRPWDSLSEDERRLFCRMAEVYAGFLAHTDHEIGRLLDFLEELGSPATCNHCPVGWARAFNTPFQMWKRDDFEGGVADPLLISWPKGIKARGELRHQFAHATDLAPTIYDCPGVEPPEVVKGFTQVPLEGVSIRSTFEGDDVATPKETGFSSMLGSRASWHKGWKAGRPATGPVRLLPGRAGHRRLPGDQPVRLHRRPDRQGDRRRLRRAVPGPGETAIAMVARE